MSKEERREITERIARKFVLLPEDGKAYVAGYIAGLEHTAAEKAPEESREAAVLEGMGLPELEWVKAVGPSREEAVSGIRQLAIDIADTVIENAFHVDTGRMRRLESAKEEAGRLQEMIGGLLEMIKKEAYQE